MAMGFLPKALQTPPLGAKMGAVCTREAQRPGGNVMKKVIACLLSVVLFAGLELPAQNAAKPAPRTWKDATGQFSIEATFVRVSDGQVVLQRADKKQISVPLAKLSEADRQYVKQLTTPKPIDKNEQEVISALEKLGATVKKDTRGHAIEVSFFKTQQFVAADLTDLQSLKHLTVLSFLISPLTGAGLEHVKGLKNLTELNLGSTRIKDDDLRHLQGLINLEKLDLMNNRGNITDAGMIHLQGLPSLKQLTLLDTFVGDTGLRHLQASTTLEYLDLRGTKITDTGLKFLPGVKNLKRLVLSGTKITDASLVHLQGTKKLFSLTLIGTKVTEAGIAELQKALPNCKISN